MAVFEAYKDVQSEFPVLLVNSGGSAVTGVAKTQVTPYYKKAGGSFTLLPQADFDWTEEDAANVPGHYTLKINAAGIGNGVLNTLGIFQITIQADAGPPAFLAYPLVAYVVPLAYWDTLRRLRGWSSVNFRIFPISHDPVTGELTSADVKIYPTQTDTDNDTNSIEVGRLTAAYNATGEVTSYKLTV
jgi:hypothetical protein